MVNTLIDRLTATKAALKKSKRDKWLKDFKPLLVCHRNKLPFWDVKNEKFQNANFTIYTEDLFIFYAKTDLKEI
jgi:hypothetical protein